MKTGRSFRGGMMSFHPFGFWFSVFPGCGQRGFWGKKKMGWSGKRQFPNSRPGGTRARWGLGFIALGGSYVIVPPGFLQQKSFGGKPNMVARPKFFRNRGRGGKEKGGKTTPWPLVWSGHYLKPKPPGEKPPRTTPKAPGEKAVNMGDKILRGIGFELSRTL